MIQYNAKTVILKRALGVFITCSGLTILLILFYPAKNTTQDLNIDAMIPKQSGVKGDYYTEDDYDAEDYTEDYYTEGEYIDESYSEEYTDTYADSSDQFSTIAENQDLEQINTSVEGTEPISTPEGFGKSWVLQVASLKDAKRAAIVVSKMEKMLLPVYIEELEVAGHLRHRVFVGPFLDSERVKTERQRLVEALGYEPVLHNYKK